MITVRMLKAEDVPLIKSSPQYPLEFAELDYALRDGGWLDYYAVKSGTEILVAEDQDVMVGFSVLSREDAGGAEFRIAVLPGKLGRGLGKTIALLTLKQGFSYPDISRIWLIVRKNNLRAMKLYETLHFRRTGECTEEVNGKWVEFYRMEIDKETFFCESMKTCTLL
ncbi:MAG: GNAT family protein [Methanoregula sp.]|jgi:diamine N-acetyltransferase|nr:GNAT family protein [Methanoregula sp.]MDD5188291.1 GNAT family protein [Methanoregula sp.]